MPQKADKPSGWTASVHIRCPTAAKAEHSVTEADLNMQHKQRHAIASKPEGPAAPLALRETERIASAFKPSNKIRRVYSFR